MRERPRFVAPLENSEEIRDGAALPNAPPEIHEET
jgi:hypothetical protein